METVYKIVRVSKGGIRRSWKVVHAAQTYTPGVKVLPKIKGSLIFAFNEAYLALNNASVRDEVWECEAEGVRPLDQITDFDSYHTDLRMFWKSEDYRHRHGSPCPYEGSVGCESITLIRQVTE